MLSIVLAAALHSSSEARYYGPPDVSLTASLIEAGGGPEHFSSRRLFAHLAGKHTVREGTFLTERYGVAAMAHFFATFNTFVDDAIAQDRSAGVTLPQVIAPAGDVMSRDLYAAGTLPDGRYDVGYMLERLLSRRAHVVLMHEVDADPSCGPQKNAQFHVILSNAIEDLNRFYAS